MIRRILALCSRDRCRKEVSSRLRDSLVRFESYQGSWENLIYEAEIQGISPLLYKHAVSSGHPVPPEARRLLQSLYLRHKRSNDIRNKTVADILTEFKKNGITTILLKGIVLSNTVYEECACRPMRDIDIFVDKRDAIDAQEHLFNLGFSREKNPEIGDDHHHLDPLVKTIEGLPLSIEVHRELLPEQLNDHSWCYEILSKTPETFSLCGIEAQTLSLENTLHYLYLHGLRAPLTYEPYRLIHVADLVSFVERNHEQINWSRLKERFPAVIDILSRLHFLTPWHPDVIGNLSLNVADNPASPGDPYCGWPLRAPNEIPACEMVQYVKDTIWPPQWWTQVYYGRINPIDYYKARFFEHPRTLWRWGKSYRFSSGSK